MRSRVMIAAFAVLVLAALACATDTGSPANNPPTLTPGGGGGTSKIVISNMTMYRDDGNGEPGEEVTIFNASDRIMHFEADASGLEPGQNVKLIFTGVNISEGRDVPIASAETGELLIASQITGQVSLDRDWPTGEYRLDIYVDGIQVYSWDYEVVE